MSEATPGIVLLDRYELIARVDDRGLGESWSASDRQQPARPVAVKFLDFSGDELAAEVAEQVKRLRMFRHPLLPAVLAHGTWQARLFVVHDAVAGESLGTRIARIRGERRLDDLMFLRRVFDQVAAMLGAAHQAPRPLLHGALTPASVIVHERRTGAFDARVVDLGIAPSTNEPADAAARSAHRLTNPALARAERAAATEAGDVAALAALLREMLSPPTRADVPAAVWTLIAQATPGESAERVVTVAALRVALAEAWKQPVSTAPPAATDAALPVPAAPAEPVVSGPSLDAQPPVDVPSTPLAQPEGPVYEMPELATVVRAPIAAPEARASSPAAVDPVDPNAWSTGVIGGAFGAQVAGPRADAAEMLARSRAHIASAAAAVSPVAPAIAPSSDPTLVRDPSQPRVDDRTFVARVPSPAPPQAQAQWPQAIPGPPVAPYAPAEPAAPGGPAPPRRTAAIVVVVMLTVIALLGAALVALRWFTSG